MTIEDKVIGIIDQNIQEVYNNISKHLNAGNQNMVCHYKSIYDYLHFVKQDIVNQFRLDDIINGKEVKLD